ncbi:MAG: hypothetical protein M3Y30_15945 [Gemmatimonadota bacterium]|nr:hypothetical protein [Gemmatimonadota bacterium]
MLWRHAASIAALGVLAAAAGAQGAPNALRRLTMLDAKALEAIEHGDAIAVTLDAPDKTEIATIGVVRLEVPRAFYLDHVKQLTGFLVSGTKTSSGIFGEPAKIDDVTSLTLDPADAKMLEKCQPLKCDVKLPASEMGKFHDELAKSHDPLPPADSLMRDWLVAYVNGYRADSTEETVVYDDTKRSVRSSDAFRALVGEPLPPGLDAEPFTFMFSVPHSARPPAVASRISWEMDRVPGLKPVLEVVERSTYASPARPDASWMSTKLLYATHYFESQVDFLTVSDAPPAPASGACYLIVLRRQKFDDLPSGGLFNIRGKAVKKLREALRATLASTRVAIASAFADSPAPLPHAP